jgi:hypothetical protein
MRILPSTKFIGWFKFPSLSIFSALNRISIGMVFDYVLKLVLKKQQQWKGKEKK